MQKLTEVADVGSRALNQSPKDKMKVKLLTWEDFTGTIGAATAISLPLIKQLLPIVQLVGALGGLVLLGYSIYHKRLEIKKLKNGNTEK